MSFLTPTLKFSEIFTLPTTQLSIGTLYLKGALIAGNNNYVRVVSALSAESTMRADATKMGYYTFLRFRPEQGNTISIWFEDKILTVSRVFPYPVTFSDKFLNDTYDQQRFDFYVHDNIIKLRSRARLGAGRQIYLSYDPTDNNTLKLIGDEQHDYEFTVTAPTKGQQNVKTNFPGNSFWVKYFNDFVDQENNKSVEINMTKSISGIPINFLCSSPYETVWPGIGKISVNLNVLKNFQTPEYEYTDNSFYVSQQKVTGKVKTADGVPLTGVPVSGFPLPPADELGGEPLPLVSLFPSSGDDGTATNYVVTDSEGNYEALVPYDWTGSLVPVLPEYSSTVANIANLQSNYQQDFVVALKSYTISGLVLNVSSMPLSSLTVYADSMSAVTDLSGSYSFQVPYNWNGTLFLSATFVFDPPSVFLVNVDEDITQNFIQTSIPVLPPFYTDDFNRADGSLGSSWAAFPDGSLAISSNKVVGTAGVLKGNYRIAETYTADQFSEITVVSSIGGADWIAPSVRNQSSGDFYFGLYAGSGTSSYVQLFKRIGGTYTNLSAPVTIGVLAAGTPLRLTIVGSTLSLSVSGVVTNLAYDTTLSSGPPGLATFGAESADNWTGGNANPEIRYINTDGNGVELYAIVSKRSGKNWTTLQVLRPTSPAAGRAHQFLYVLPVESYGSYAFGNPMDTVRLLNAHNNYNATLIAPSFGIESWYANHSTDPEIQYESFMTQELQPWVEANLTTSGTEQHLLLGFSKSGFGGVDLLLKHPDLFDRGAFWDMPTTGFTAYDQYGGPGGSSSLNYGTDANFQANYRMTSSFFDTYKAPFQVQNRIFMSGYSFYLTEITNLDPALTAKGILHTYPALVNRGSHSWGSGWVPEALSGLFAYTDDFARADGTLGPNWTTPVTTTVGANGVMVIASNQVKAVLDDTHAMAIYSTGTFTNDQYSQIKIVTMGAWTGVIARAEPNVDRFYMAFVFGANDYRLYRWWDGAYLQLAADTTATWSVGDVLKLEVIGDATTGVNCWLSRNGTRLLKWIAPDSTWIKTGGKPGLGIYSPAGLNLRDDFWEGGNISGGVVVGGVVVASDNFNRINGAIGSNWTNTPAAEATLTITSNQVTTPTASKQYYTFYNAASFTNNQWAQVRLSALGQFSGVILRADASLNRFYLGFYDNVIQKTKIYVMWDGTLTELVGSALPSVGWSAGDILRMDIVGSVHPITITIYRNGGQFASWTSPNSGFVRAGGSPGINVYSLTSGMVLDDWTGGNL